MALHRDEQEVVGMKLMRLILVTAALSSMSALMFNIVIPEISDELHLSLPQVSWLSSGYILIYAFGTVTYGKLADRFALKNVLTFGLVLFALGSLIGVSSQSFWVALAGRLLQSAGASAIPAMAMIVPIRYFAPERRGAAMSMTVIGLAIGSVLGPVVSAVILSFAHWRWLFVPPLLLLALVPLFRKHLNVPANGGHSKFDWIGGGTLFAAVAFLLLGLTYWSWWWFALSLLAWPAFAVRIRTAKGPFIQPALFRNNVYRAGLFIAFLLAGMANALFYLSPVLLADVYGIDAQWIGYALIPAAAASALLGKQGGKLADRSGNVALYTLACGLLVGCFALLSTFAGAVAAWTIAAMLILGNVGQTFMQVAVANSMSTTLPKDQIGIGMGLFSMANFIAIGMAAGIYSRLAEMEAASWNPFHTDAGSGSGVFSNIYLVLALLHIGMLLFYRATFAAGTRDAAVRLKHR